MSNGLKSLSDDQAQRRDRDNVDIAVVLAARDPIFVNLSQCANPSLRFDSSDAFEILFDIKYLYFILPSTDKDKLLSQEETLCQF